MKTKAEKPYVEMPPFVLTEKQIVGWDLTYEESYKIPANWGVGFKWKDKNGNLFETVLSAHAFENGKRVASLCQSNYLGSLGASHYYANINVHSPSIYDHSEKKIYACAGYGPEREKVDPFIGGIRLEAQRVLTKVEKDVCGEMIGKIGEKTYRFNSEAEAKAAGLRTFLARFAPGWVLKDDDDCNVVLAET